MKLCAMKVRKSTKLSNKVLQAGKNDGVAGNISAESDR